MARPALSWLSCAVVVCVLAAANLAIGRSLGYTQATPYLTFWVAAGLAGAAGWRFAREAGFDHGTDVALATAVFAVAAVILTTLLAGSVRRLSTPVVLLGETCVLAVSLCRRVPPPFSVTHEHRTLSSERIPAAPVAALIAVLAFAAAFAVWNAPLTLYDALSYHLHFSARWVQDHAVQIIPTPFSDEAQAYAPGNGELWFAWLMLPFHGDLLARMGQLPFAFMGALAVYGIARQLGAEPRHAIYPAAFFILTRPVVEQAIGANVDLVCAAFFTSAVYFGVRASERDARRDWVACGICAGLFAGTKYLALTYAPALLLVGFSGWRKRALWTIPGVAAFGLPWYVRNWVVAGSPIYPATLSVGPLTLARGAFSRAAMLNTVFHTANLRLLPVVVERAVGAPLVFVWLPCAIVGWVAMARRGRRAHLVLALLPAVMLGLFWYMVPVNIDSRFLMPALGPALVPMAFVFTKSARVNRVIHVVYALAFLWLSLSPIGHVPYTALPWFMDGWLAFEGLIPPQSQLLFVLVAAASVAVWIALRRLSSLPAAAALIVGITCTAVWLALAPPASCGDSCRYLSVTDTFIRSDYIASWRWVSSEVRNSTVAYTGINLPYPLTGQQLTNRVVYVNIDGSRRWLFHNYVHAYRAGDLPGTSPRIAVSSGELLPDATPRGEAEDALRPRYERMTGNRDVWLYGLKMARANYLYVAKLSAYEHDYQWHDENGFPIEDTWARSDPGEFALQFSNGGVRIYKFEPESIPQG